MKEALLMAELALTMGCNSSRGGKSANGGAMSVGGGGDGGTSSSLDGPCMPMRDAGGSPDSTSDIVSVVGAEDFSCGKPSCCVPITIDPSRVYVYRNSDGGSVAMVLSFDTPPSSWWDMNVDVLLPLSLIHISEPTRRTPI